MIEVRIGYDNIYKNGELNPNGAAMWCCFYITDDFKDFYTYDGVLYYKNMLAPVDYGEINEWVKEFSKEFKNINCMEDLENQKHILYIEKLPKIKEGDE